MWLAKILSFSFLNPFVKYTKHSAPQWVEELDLTKWLWEGFPFNQNVLLCLGTLLMYKQLYSKKYVKKKKTL